ncbi:Protein ABHD15 [Trichinella pseudospiralis]
MIMLFALLCSISLVSCIHPKYLYRDAHSRFGKRDGSMILPLEQNNDSDEDIPGGSPRDRFGPNKPPPPGFMEFFPFASDESMDMIPFDDSFSPEQSAWMDKDYSCRSTECSKEENAWYACAMLSDACMERMAPMVECDEIKQRCIKLKAHFARCFNECTRVEYDNLKKMVKNIRIDQPPPQPRATVKRQK